MCDNMMTDNIGHELKAINHLLHRRMVKSAVEAGIDNVTIMHGWIICFLDKNSGRDIFQKDIEQKFGISKSTVTNILKLMEKKGYIIRESVENDARLKKLTLTEKGKRLSRDIRKTVTDNERKLNNVLSEEERNFFLQTIHKLRNALEQAE